VDRPSLFFLHFASERNYYYLCWASVLLIAFVVKRLRASRPGRVLIALREDEYGVQTFGINATRMRLAGFALSGAIAGWAGMLFVHHQRALDVGSYGSFASIQIFIMAMIGGITSVTGAVLGAAYYGLVNFIFTDAIIRNLGSSAALMVLLIIAPGGLAQISFGARDAILRIIATRQHIVVPSLFADYDPAAIERKKLPLAAPTPGHGLGALKDARRYTTDSELYPLSRRSVGT
jgi:branched-chain amino acid transport system permease protein